MRDDGRVHADERASHRGAEPDPLGRVRDRADHVPHERAVPLGVDPRMDVIRDEDVLEAGVLCANRVRDEVGRAVLLG